MAFASRLKRLHERLIRDVGRLYEGLGFNFEPRWFLLFYSLHARGPASITELASALSQSHAAVNQVAGELLKAGLVSEVRQRGDDRKRLLRLTPRGRALASRMVPIWREIGDATTELFRDSGVDMVAGLAATEQALEAASIYDRVRVARGESIHPPITILEYRPAFKKHFRELNYAWLREHFTVEPEDERLLSDPNGRIIKRGGAVLFAAAGEQILGTCALIRHSDSDYELAKMAVAEASRRRGLGRALGLATIDRAAHLGGRRLFLLTSPKLTAAIALYRKLGFEPCPLPDDAAVKYKRCTIAMELALSPKSRSRMRR
jgi:GNAT superfamily N-acetyltransferase/DNA-binding MarR family transcriptional regulator